MAYDKERELELLWQSIKNEVRELEKWKYYRELII